MHHKNIQVTNLIVKTNSMPSGYDLPWFTSLALDFPKANITVRAENQVAGEEAFIPHGLFEFCPSAAFDTMVNKEFQEGQSVPHKCT